MSQSPSSIPESRYVREWRLKSSPEAFWPYISDTHRFNRDWANAPLRKLKGGERSPNAYRQVTVRVLQAQFLPSPSLEFEEEPFEWVRPHRYSSIRRFRPGQPLSEVRVTVELIPLPEGGTRLIYETRMRAGQWMFAPAIPIALRFIYLIMDGIIRKYDKVASMPGPSLLTLPAQSVHFVPGGRERLAAARAELLRLGADPNLVARLASFVETADDLALAHIRPYALADYWGLPRWDVLELCLRAVRAGLLEFRWEILCPLCRNEKQSATTLSELSSQVHCDTCNIDFSANFARSVELAFSPNPAIRTREVGEFCVGGPQLTPHVVAQQLLPVGGRRTLTLPLEEGRYRLRALELPGGQSLVVVPHGDSEATISARLSGWPEEELALAPNVTLGLENDTDSEQLFVLERMAWSDQAVMAAEVTASQLFRDLFAREALRPGEKISVGSLTIMFTDLRGSTRLYRDLGDAAAFGRVMSHFDTLKEAITSEGGAIVKTIGDAVMAVFPQPAAALRTILKVQHQLANPPDGILPLQLKAGIHYGPCIAVTLNERLDYFGSTVNLASRLESLSAQGGIVISETVRSDPGAAAYFDSIANLIAIEPFAAEVKGFEGESFALWRVRLKEEIAARVEEG
jgi:class 3 adenylate cyclase